MFDIVVKMISIKGSYVGNRRDAKEAVDFFARGLVKFPYKVVPLEELPKVFDLLGKFKILIQREKKREKSSQDYESCPMMIGIFANKFSFVAQGKVTGRYVLKMPETG